MGERNAALPKFGEWDVKNPATATEFSVIFDKARNAKRDGILPPPTRRDQLDSPARKDRPKTTARKWLCCVGWTHD